MFVAQVGYYSWLSDVVPVTNSGAHAKRFPTEEAAKLAIQAFNADRKSAVAHMLPKARVLYLTLPTAVISAAELDARLADLTKPRGGVVSTPDGSEPPDATPSARRQGGGITKAIFEWTRSHPEATKADAIAAFPDANRSTVSVQFSAARREG